MHRWVASCRPPHCPALRTPPGAAPSRGLDGLRPPVLPTQSATPRTVATASRPLSHFQPLSWRPLLCRPSAWSCLSPIILPVVSLLWGSYSSLTIPFGGPRLPSQDEGVRPGRDQPAPRLPSVTGHQGPGRGEAEPVTGFPQLFLRGTALPRPQALSGGGPDVSSHPDSPLLPRGRCLRPCPGRFPTGSYLLPHSSWSLGASLSGLESL